MKTSKKIPSFIEHHQVLSSTNDRAWELILERGDASDRGVVTAGYQEKGRGRNRRTWSSEKNSSLLMSLVVIPEDEQNLQLLPLASGLAVVKAIMKYAEIEASIKWPNDIMFGNKKMGGILVELKTSGNEILGAVIGIGLNIKGGADIFPEELRVAAVTLETAVSKECEPDAFMKILFDELNIWIEVSFSDPERLGRELNGAWAHKKGDTLKVHSGGSIVEGRFAGVSEEGALILQTESGENRFVQGEILNIGEYS
jgi:BirA family transcriptional regulator, biotin operon repressor / biotin---[acetyl-CoA-carboxylase] ligase